MSCPMGVQMKACSNTARSERGTPQRHRLYAALFVALGAIAMGNSVHAQARDAELTPQNYSIAAGSLGDALNQLASQSKLQIVYSPELVRGKTAPAITGRQTWREALQKLLAGSGLEWGVVNDTTVVIRQANVTPPSAVERPNTRSSAASERNEDRHVVGLPGIVVHGERTLNMDVVRTRDDAQPYVIFEREMIERSGAVDLENFFRQNLTMNAQAEPMSAQGQTATTLSNSVDLRGLGFNQTLILVDGRRLAATASTTGGSFLQPAIKGIPLSAIERIEVLPTTASGIYGGSATGGVINIILRRGYQGSEVKLTYDDTFDTDSAIRRIDFSTSVNFEKSGTSVLISGSYSDGNALLSGDRDFTSRGRQHILANDPNFYFGAASPPLGYTPNIRSVTGANLVLDNGVSLGSPYTFVPVGYLGPATDNGTSLLANAGQYNFDQANTGNGQRRALLSSPKEATLSASLRQELTPSLQAFVDLGVTEVSSNYQFSTDPMVILPASAPGNPFLQDIRVMLPLVGTPVTDIQYKSTDHRAVVGLIKRFANHWHAGLDYTWQRWEREPSSFPGGLRPEFDAAVVSGSIDPLRDPNVFAIDATELLYPPNSRSSVTTSLKEYNLRISGPVMKFPAGDVTLSSLLAYREEVLGEQSATNNSFLPISFVTISPELSQSIRSAYAELNVPLFSKTNQRLLAKELDVQIAARRDDYSINGANASINYFDGVPLGTLSRVTNKIGSTDLTVGFRYRPVDNLLLRASYGTGFLPPGVTQLLSSPRNPNSSASTTVDPRRGGLPIGGFIATTGGGNPNLQPEQSRSWSAGLVLTPTFSEHLRVSLDYTQIEKTDNIQPLQTQAVIDNEAYLPGRVIRAESCPGDPYAPVCPITEVIETLANVARAEVRAYDLRVDYDVPTQNFGRFNLSAAATWQPHFRTQLTPTSPTVDSAGIATFSRTIPIKFKSNASLVWERNDWRFGWTVYHFDSYLVADPDVASNASLIRRQGRDGRIPSQNYHDALVSWEPMSYASNRSWLSGVQVLFLLRNVFDSEPPVDVRLDELYSPFGDPRLRSYALSIRKSF